MAQWAVEVETADGQSWVNIVDGRDVRRIGNDAITIDGVIQYYRNGQKVISVTRCDSPIADVAKTAKWRK